MGFLSKVIGAVAPALGAATGNPVLGAVGSGIGAAFATDDAQDFATNSAQQANAFTKEQLQNRHQWEVADLRKAGLNPILSALRGTPSIGGSAQAVAQGNAALDAATLSQSASAARAVRLNEQKLQSEIELLQANSTAAKTQGVKNLAEARNTGNIGNITQNLGNLASGFHGLTTNVSSKVKNNLNELWNIGDIIKRAVEKNKAKGVYSLDYYNPFKKGN